MAVFDNGPFIPMHFKNTFAFIKCLSDMYVELLSTSVVSTDTLGQMVMARKCLIDLVK